MPPDLALVSTLIGSNYPCLELIFMVPEVFEPLEFDCSFICTTNGQTIQICVEDKPLQNYWFYCKLPFLTALLQVSWQSEKAFTQMFPSKVRLSCQMLYMTLAWFPKSTVYLSFCKLGSFNSISVCFKPHTVSFRRLGYDQISKISTPWWSIFQTRSSVETRKTAENEKSRLSWV